jgi:hypothetical protein
MRRGAVVLALLLACANLPANAADLIISVVVQGSLDGTDANHLPGILVSEMARTNDRWQFEPGSSQAPNRIEWTLKPGSDASGEVRSFGMSRAMMRTLEGSHRTVSVEAKLYLDNQYQATVSGQIRDTGNPRDAQIAGEINELTHELMSNIPSPRS